MRSIEAALAIDFFRRGMLVIPLALLVMIAVPLWLFVALDGDGALVPTAREAIVLHVVLTLALGFGAAVSIFQAQGKLARFFVRPISAMRLVGCQMGLGMAMIAAMYVLAATLINLKGVGWPVLGPALFLATTLACALAAIWSLEGSVFLQFLGCTATSAPLVIWFNRCYGARIMGDWQFMWKEPTAGEALSLAAISAGAFAVAIAGVTRVRRGDAWNSAALVAWWERQSFFTAPATFRSPLASQLWCEWRQKLWPVPACLIAITLLIAGSAWVTGYMPTQTMLEFVVGMSIVLLGVVIPMTYGLVVGNCGRETGPMKQYLATRPVTDSFLAKVLLRTCTTAMSTAWATWLIGLALFAGLAYLVGHRADVIAALSPPGFHNSSQFWHWALMCSAVPLASWTITALMATLVATGRPWLWCTILIGIFAVGSGVAATHKFFPPIVLDLFSVSVAAIYLFGTVAAFVAATRQRLISGPTVIYCFGAWLVMSAVVIAICLPYLQHEGVWFWHAVGIFALAVLPFAAMPLAVRWNRHR